MDIAAWLQSLGMQQYEEAFRNNAIDAAVLPELTADDLKDLGVSLVGHRRKLLAAVAALRSQGGSVPPAANEGGSTAERRQLSVMFCDLVGSTPLSRRLDPEDLREVVGGYHRYVAVTVGRFAGFVAKYIGDGVLIYFGYPEAHEDDAERAVRAGLALIEGVGKVTAPEPLQVRIGLATGLVIVGDLIGAGAAQEQAVVGETPNLAARLQSLARPGVLMIDANTRRLVGDLFEFHDLGGVEAKGFAEAVRAWQVLRPSLVESRFEALRASSLTPFVGREEEIEFLLRRWARAKEGHGQVVQVSGEPGIGKSRVAAVLADRLRDQPSFRLRYFCNPHYENSALYPVTAQLERAAGFAREDSPATRLEKLRALLAHSVATDEETELIGELLSLPLLHSRATAQLTPERKKEKTLEALLRQMEALSEHSPLLMVWEDAHWIDPTSRELLDLTIARVRHLKVLLVITFRPEFEPRWTGGPYVASLTLSRLDAQDGTALAERVAGKSLPPAIATRIAARAEGIPLFVEELTRALVEAGSMQDDASQPALLAIPPSLHASLLARLDRLGPAAKEAAQIGATIGREFSYELVAAVARCRDNELRPALNQLAEAGLVFRRGEPPHATYFFKHALVQDAAYGTLLRGPRRELHARIGRALEEQLPAIVETHPEILAGHYTEAGAVERAIDYWRKAGERALAHSANVEAVQHLTKGVELTRSLPLGLQRDRKEFGLQLALGPAMRATTGHGAPETIRVFSRAGDLVNESATVNEQMTVLYGLWGGHLIGNQNVAAARELAERCLTLAARHSDADASALAARLMGFTLFTMGEFREAADYLKRTVEFCPPGEKSVPDLRFTHDHAASGFAYLGWALCPLGYPDQAVRAAMQAIDRARAIDHAMTTGVVLTAKAILSADLGADFAQAEADADTALAYAVEHRLRQYEGWAHMSRGTALLQRGDPRRAIEAKHVGIAIAEKIDAKWSNSMRAGHLALAHAKIGEPDVGLKLLDQALAQIEETQERFFEAELHRIRGEILIEGGKRRAGEEALQSALRVASRQQARLWESRAATRLARLWRGQGRTAAARDLLAPVYGWFTEGFDTADLKEAKALMDELGG